MDSSTRRVLNSIREYLDDVESRQHRPIDGDTVKALNEVADTLTRGTIPTELSPGQRQAAEAAGGVYERVTMDEDDGLSPGQRQAAEFSSI